MRFYEEWHQLKWGPVWRSIIQKYEVACGEEREDVSNNPGQLDK
jgi:hypothetical protein